ncbi:MAG: DUF4114 domain-containing protein [Verrucomicrobiales bacterium]|nr:DUF4114 domain-containing protein [Verrucomicrobiota bacterium JB025]
MNSRPPYSLALAGLLALANAASGQTESPVQSAASPYDLDIISPVQLAGSDESSATFQSEVLPDLLSLANKSLSEQTTVDSINSISLDPSDLVLAEDATVRVYFLSEGAGYKNSLGISTTGGGPVSDDAALIFPNASSASGLGGSNSDTRSSSEPLAAGDFVDLGTYTAGTTLDFFLIANGATGGSQYYSTDLSLNSDGIVHAVTLAQDGSAYLIIGFEDLYGGGDEDYNDLLIAVEINSANVSNLVSLNTPEPTLALGSLIALTGIAGLSRRRRA